MKKNTIKVGIIVLLALQCFMLLVMPMITTAAVKDLKFDDTAVMDDLLSSLRQIRIMTLPLYLCHRAKVEIALS